MPSGLPTAPDDEIGGQPPPTLPPKIPRPNARPSIPIIGDTPILFNPVIILPRLAKNSEFMNKLHIKDARTFLELANDLLKWIPHENFKGKDIKNILWTIGSLLQGSQYAREFEGAIWMHAFLNTYNYHCQHAPVAGKVLEAKNIQGAAYLEFDAKCLPIRVMFGPDAPDSPGYQFLQTRGMVVIDNPVVSKVAVLPIGMAMVSSVKLSVKKGDVLKGDEISSFLFGRSDIICVFQAKSGLKVNDFKGSTWGTYSKYGTMLAKAPVTP